MLLVKKLATVLFEYLKTKELVNNAYHFGRQQRARDIIIVIERLSWSEKSTVHLWIHNLTQINVNTVTKSQVKGVNKPQGLQQTQRA
jgi:hypothetical protein